MRPNQHQQSKPLKINRRPRDDDEDDYKMRNGGGVSSCENCGFPDMRQDGRKFCSYACGKQASSKSKMYNYDETKYDDEDELEKSQESISVWIWPDWRGDLHYYGCLGQQSYSYAKDSNDIVIAYNYPNIDKDWFLWLLKMNKLSPSQFIWIQTKDIPTWEDLEIDAYLLKQIALIIERKLIDNPALQIRLKPFAMIPAAENIIDTIKSNISVKNKDNIVTCCANNDWADKFANKACLHRFISTPDKPSLFEKCGVYSDVNGLTECKGYICKNKEELLRAYDKLGITNVAIKDCWGHSGDDISFYNSKQQITEEFKWKDQFKYMEIEEDLRFNKHEIARVEFIGCQFYDNKVLGVADQIIVNDRSYAGSMTYTNKETSEELERITSEVMKKIGTKYMGGFDFAVQTFKDKSIDPKIYLIDMNTGRYTAPMQSFIVMNKFDIKNKYFIRKTLKIKDTARFKEILKENSDLLFNKMSKVGAYFNMFHPKNKVSIVSIIGENKKDANDRLKELESIKYLCQ